METSLRIHHDSVKPILHIEIDGRWLLVAILWGKIALRNPSLNQSIRQALWKMCKFYKSFKYNLDKREREQAKVNKKTWKDASNVRFI